MPTRFILVSAPRSGSTMTRTTLAAHPQIHMHGEAMARNAVRTFQRTFLPSEMRKLGRDEFRKTIFLDRSRDTRRFMTSKLFAVDESKRAVGFKLLVDQALSVHFADGLSWLLEQSDLKILWLQRKNCLARHVSDLLRVKNRISANRNDRPPPALTTDVDPEQFQQDMKNQKAAMKLLRSLLVSHASMEIEYEETVRDPRTVYRKIFSFLDVDSTVEPSVESPESKKLTNLSDKISNLDSIRDHEAIRPFL